MKERTRATMLARRLLGLVACGAVVVLAVPANSAVAAIPIPPAGETTADASAPVATEAPQLSISIDNGKTATTAGEKLDFVITVQNLGVADTNGLWVNQSIPTGMEFGTADSNGTADAGYVTWTVDLKATTTATFHTTMTVGTTPAELLRLATVACASSSADSPPIVCAAHSDQLPAGRAAEQAQEVALVAPPAPADQTWWYVLAGVVVVMGLGGLLAWWAIRRRRRVAPAEPDALALTR